MAAFALIAAGAPALAVGTVANTPINNTATVSYEDPTGAPRSANSNTTTLRVDELLDVTVADGGSVTVFTPDGNRALAFTVTNTGNGTEPFELVATNLGGDDFDATGVDIYLDDGDGVFDGGDTLYVFNANDPVLAPGGARVVFIVGDIPASLASGNQADLSLRATAVTASATGDPAGTVFISAGDGGTDAVAGNSTASAVDQASFLVASVTASLVKSQAVTDPFGGSNALPGAVITYTLTFTLSGTGNVTLAQIADPIPANATYVAGSITLNSVALTDAADTDEGAFTGSGIVVNLASPLASPSTQIVTFQVTID